MRLTTEQPNEWNPIVLCFIEGEGDEGGGSGGDGGGDDSGAAAAADDAAAGAAADKAAADKASAEAETTWRDDLPDDLKPHAERFTSVAEVLKGNLDQRKQLSAAIIPPGKDATDEDIASYRKQIGVPETPDKYEFAADGEEEPTEFDKEFRTAIGTAMHARNIPAEAAKELSEVYNDFVAKAAVAQDEADKKFADESEAALRKLWPGIEWDRNKEFGDRALTRLMGDEVDEARHLETKDGRFVLDHPVMLKAFAAIGREMAEGGLVPPLSADDRDAAADQLTTLRTKQTEAQAKGDSAEANRLFEQEQALIAKTQGNQSIVGAGRAA